MPQLLLAGMSALAILVSTGGAANSVPAVSQAELTFTRANQTWTAEAQEIEDALARAARGDGDLDAIAARLATVELGYEQWEVLYRLLLQVRLRTSPLETDALVPLDEPIPPIGRRFGGLIAAFRSLYPRRRQRTSSRTG